ncbi:MAG: energy transducer TonB [Acidobacteriota bacterium]
MVADADYSDAALVGPVDYSGRHCRRAVYLHTVLETSPDKPGERSPERQDPGNGQPVCGGSAAEILENVVVVKGLEGGLDPSAVESVRQWRFQSTVKDGAPVPIGLNVEVNFALDH